MTSRAAAGQVRPLARSVAHTAAQHALYSQALAAQLGIGASDLECLTTLYDLGPATPGQLAEVLGLTSGAVTGVVDRLVASGFVVRESDPDDRRRVIVSPVAERAEEYETAQAPLLAALAGVVDTASDAELHQLQSFQARLAELLAGETARIRGEHTARASGSSLSALLGDLSAGVLEFASGAADLRIGALEDDDASNAALYAATFEGPQPSVRVQSGTVSVRYRRLRPFEWGGGVQGHSGSIGLSARIPWSIGVRGGASGVSIEAGGLLLRELAIGGGANKVDVCLPRPSGTLELCFDGGVSRVQIRRPADVPAEVRVHGGANRLEFDDQRFGAVGGDVRLASPGWDLATDRYAIEVRGGASRLAVQELQEGVPHAHDIW